MFGAFLGYFETFQVQTAVLIIWATIENFGFSVYFYSNIWSLWLGLGGYCFAICVTTASYHPCSQRQITGSYRKIVESTCGQSYKHFTLVNYDSRVVPDWKIPPYYDPRVINYERKMIIRLATEVDRESFAKKTRPGLVLGQWQILQRNLRSQITTLELWYRQFYSQYASRVVNYDHKFFIRLVTDLNQRCTPEVFPRSKITKCPEEQQEQEQLKQLPSPWAIGRSQKLKLRNIFQTGTTTRSRRRRRGCGRSKFHGIGSNVRQGHKKSDWFKKFFNIKRMTTTTTVLL